MKHLFTLLIIFCCSYSSKACCAAGMDQLYLLGRSKGKLVYAHFQLSRYCGKPDGRRGGVMGKDASFWWVGKVDLIYFKKDTINIIQNIDSFNFIECKCFYNNFTEHSNLNDSLIIRYQKAFNAAKKLHKFVEATPVSYKYYADSIGGGYELRDSLFISPNKTRIMGGTEFTLSGFMTTILDIRTYQIGGKRVEIITTAPSRYTKNTEARNKENEKQFSKIQTAFTTNYSAWHSEMRSYVFKR